MERVPGQPAASPEFSQAVADSLLLDPMPTFRNLSRSTGVPVDDLVHHALVRWVSAGAEALMLIEPQVMRDLIDARRREDWAEVGALIDWLAAGR
jgi:hypothetical protein